LQRSSILAFSLYLWPLSAIAVAPQDIQNRTTVIERCFASGIEQLHQVGTLERSPDSVYRRVFVFEQIEKHLVNQDGQPGALFTEDPKRFCEERLIKVYREAVLAARKRQKESSPDILAPSGTRPIESDKFFIEKTQNLTGKHIVGHSDITEAAIDRLPSRIRFSPSARELVSRSSQSPDLYRWNQERYHAHTPTYKPGDRTDRARNIAKGQQDFRELLVTLTDQFKRHARDGAYNRALFILGLGLHAVQDLVYHRGMTLQQHAGLSYTVNRNPDLPKGGLERQRSEEAVVLSVQFIERLFTTLANDSRSGLLSWAPSDTFSFREIARSVFNSDEDISVSALISYWALSNDYRTGNRPTAELSQTDDCANHDGLACWIPQDVLKGSFIE